MSSAVKIATRSEKGLLTPHNCVVAFIDLQPQMLFGVANFDRQSIINNNLILAKAARHRLSTKRGRHRSRAQSQRSFAGDQLVARMNSRVM